MGCKDCVYVNTEENCAVCDNFDKYKKQEWKVLSKTEKVVHLEFARGYDPQGLANFIEKKVQAAVLDRAAQELPRSKVLELEVLECWSNKKESRDYTFSIVYREKE